MSGATLMHPLLNALHVLSVVIWVGGMLFAYLVLRPTAAAQLPPPERLTLWVGVFQRFFPWVWAAIVLILFTGLGMMYAYFGGMKSPPYVQTMFGLGLIMMFIFMHVFFAPYGRLKRAVAAKDWQAGGRNLATIRKLVGLNAVIGVIVIVVAAGGHWLGI